MATRTKTYAQLAREIAALQASANKLRARETQDAISSINASIALYGLTAEDLRFESTSSSSSPAPVRQQAKVSSGASASKSSDAKFSDGLGQVWSGRGPRPIWLRNALLQGRTLESFAVSASSSGASDKTSAKTAAPAKSAAAKPVNKLPALFQHAKSGKTWSGRGPQPAWLKQGLKKRGATLDDFRMSKPDATPSGLDTPVAPLSASTKTPVAAKKTSAAKKATAASTASPAVPASAKKAAAKKSTAHARTSPVAAKPTKGSPAPAAKKTAAAKRASAGKKASIKTTPARKAKAQPVRANGSSPSSDAAPPETALTSSTVPEASPSPV